jgi:hypothetical protein
LTTLSPGQQVTVSGEATNGWRTVRLPDGRVGYLRDAELLVQE